MAADNEKGSGDSEDSGDSGSSGSSASVRAQQVAEELNAREIFQVRAEAGEIVAVEFCRHSLSQPNGEVQVRVEVWVSREGERRLEGSISREEKRRGGGGERWKFRSNHGWGKVLEGGSWRTAAAARREVRGWVRWEVGEFEEAASVCNKPKEKIQ